jgi:hypothetical protein
MKPKFSVIVAMLCAALLTGPISARADTSANGPVHYYLSLGDSLAAGEQPTLPFGQNFGDEGYADQLYAFEQSRIPNLKLVKLGCGGETTASMITAVPTVTVPGIGRSPMRAGAITSSAASRTALSSPTRSISYMRTAASSLS